MSGDDETFLLPDGTGLIIFDADGTLRRTTVAGKPCPHAPDEWELLPGVRTKLTELMNRTQANVLSLGVASNQDQIAYGHLTAAMARRLLCEMFVEAVGRAPRAGAIRFCPHALEVPCQCRKPAPGMLITLMREFGVPPSRTLFVGDAETDREAARRAGISFAWAWDFFGRTEEEV